MVKRKGVAAAEPAPYAESLGPKLPSKRLQRGSMLEAIAQSNPQLRELYEGESPSERRQEILGNLLGPRPEEFGPRTRDKSRLHLRLGEALLDRLVVMHQATAGRVDYTTIVEVALDRLLTEAGF